MSALGLKGHSTRRFKRLMRISCWWCVDVHNRKGVSLMWTAGWGAWNTIFLWMS